MRCVIPPNHRPRQAGEKAGPVGRFFLARPRLGWTPDGGGGGWAQPTRPAQPGLLGRSPSAAAPARWVYSCHVYNLVTNGS